MAPCAGSPCSRTAAAAPAPARRRGSAERRCACIPFLLDLHRAGRDSGPGRPPAPLPGARLQRGRSPRRCGVGAVRDRAPPRRRARSAWSATRWAARSALRCAGPRRASAPSWRWPPGCRPASPPASWSGRTVVMAHGTRDRTTSPARSLAYALAGARGLRPPLPVRGRRRAPRHAGAPPHLAAPGAAGGAGRARAAPLGRDACSTRSRCPRRPAAGCRCELVPAHRRPADSALRRLRRAQARRHRPPRRAGAAGRSPLGRRAALGHRRHPRPRVWRRHRRWLRPAACSWPRWRARVALDAGDAAAFGQAAAHARRPPEGGRRSRSPGARSRRLAMLGAGG